MEFTFVTSLTEQKEPEIEEHEWETVWKLRYLLGSEDSLNSLVLSSTFEYITFKQLITYRRNHGKTKATVPLVFNFCDGQTTDSLKLGMAARHCKNLISGRTIRAIVLIGGTTYRHQLDTEGRLQPRGSYHMLYAECRRCLDAGTKRVRLGRMSLTT